jgi:4-amino-4-deoxy-L-arabinose transferase-like glycosyltransferase
LVVGVAAMRLAGLRVGLLAAALMAVAPIEVMQTHFASVDAMLVLWMTLATIAGCAVASGGSRAAVVCGGIASGFAIATKYTGVAVLTSLGWGIVEDWWKQRSMPRLLGEATRWETLWFLHDDIYAWLDPALRTTWHGRTGFRIYVPAAP